MTEGIIVEIVRSHGYGFIIDDDGQKVFFHQRWLKSVKFRELQVGQKVAFKLIASHRGLRAQNLIKAEDKDKSADSVSADTLFK